VYLTGGSEEKVVLTVQCNIQYGFEIYTITTGTNLKLQNSVSYNLTSGSSGYEMQQTRTTTYLNTDLVIMISRALLRCQRQE